MYDWANSVFPLTITSAIFPIYWKSNTPENISICGVTVDHSSLYDYCLSLAFLLVALIAPILSGIADSSGSKKNFMFFFILLGGLSCITLSGFDIQNLSVGIYAFILATIGYAGSIVFYNAFLPEIVSSENLDKVSAKGFSFGYVGAVLLLIVNLLLIMHPEWIYNINAKAELLRQANASLNVEQSVSEAIGFYKGEASRLSFIMVGVWWIGFSLIPLYYLPNAIDKRSKLSIWKGYRELKIVFNEVRKNEAIKKYLLAFFFISMGVQTVMYVSVMFGTKELKLADEQLIITVLLIQLVAVVGAMLTSFLSRKIGNLNVLLILAFAWILVCVVARFVYSAQAFYALATSVGFIMGGVQSLARSTYAKYIPIHTKDHASYFSFYEFSEKIAIVLGTFSFGIINDITGTMRNSILALILFFIIGFIFLLYCKKKLKINYTCN